MGHGGMGEEVRLLLAFLWDRMKTEEKQGLSPWVEGLNLRDSFKLPDKS